MQGDGVSGAQVFVNGRLSASTDERGSYTLSNITSGAYRLLVCVCVCVCLCVCVCVCYVCVRLCIRG